jgi:hypothetical protein
MMTIENSKLIRSYERRNKSEIPQKKEQEKVVNLSISPSYRFPEQGLFSVLLKLIRHNEIYLRRCSAITSSFFFESIKLFKQRTGRLRYLYHRSTLYTIVIHFTFGGFPKLSSSLLAKPGAVHTLTGTVGKLGFKRV